MILTRQIFDMLDSAQVSTIHDVGAVLVFGIGISGWLDAGLLQ
jgi:hypothetical protein